MLYLFVLLIGCCQSQWNYTDAEITNVEEIEVEGKMEYPYTYKYDASKANVKNAQGDKITVIEQHGLDSKRKPKKGQKIKIRYRKDEPIIFEILESIQYEQ